MNVIVLQHVAVEHPGVFTDFFREDDARLHTVELDEGEPIPALDPPGTPMGSLCAVAS